MRSGARAVLLRGFALACCQLVSTGCFLKEHFVDMRLQAARVPLPESYVFVGQLEGGTKPRFKNDPHHTRVLVSPHDLMRTCEELAERLPVEREAWARRRRSCSATFDVGAGWRARPWGVWHYRASVSATAIRAKHGRLVPNEPSGAYTRVLVSGPRP